MAGGWGIDWGHTWGRAGIDVQPTTQHSWMPRMNNGATQTIRGATHFVLREEGGVWRVAVHRDYWDAAEELYEKLPVVGGLMRWLKNRANS